MPVQLRKKYGIDEGSVLEVEGTGSGILLKKAKSTLDLLGLAGVLRKKSSHFL